MSSTNSSLPADSKTVNCRSQPTEKGVVHGTDNTCQDPDEFSHSLTAAYSKTSSIKQYQKPLLVKSNKMSTDSVSRQKDILNIALRNGSRIKIEKLSFESYREGTQNLQYKSLTGDLLEEFEAALPREYSLKRSLNWFTSVTIYRAHERLSRVPANGEINKVMNYLADNTEVTSWIEETINRLKRTLTVQRSILDHTSLALKVSIHTKNAQSDLITLEKSYLIEAITYEAISKEIERISKFFLGKIFVHQSGLAKIKEIHLCIPKRLNSYSFLLIVAGRGSVKFTELQKRERKTIIFFFEKTIEFLDIRYDFIISLYLYGTIKNGHSRLQSKRDLKNNLTSGVQANLQRFVLLGTAEILVSQMLKKDLSIQSEFGDIRRNVTLSIEGNVDIPALHSGFLDIRHLDERKSKLLTHWARYWFRLTDSNLQGWSFPSQQATTPPAHEIWLAHCISEDVKPIKDCLCARPNAFTFFIKDDNEKIYQVFCAADSSAEVEYWCYILNKVISYHRNCS